VARGVAKENQVIGVSGVSGSRFAGAARAWPGRVRQQNGGQPAADGGPARDIARQCRGVPRPMGGCLKRQALRHGRIPLTRRIAAHAEPVVRYYVEE